MQLNIQISDVRLEQELSDYIARKQVQVSDLLKQFLHKESNRLSYPVRDPDQNATTLDYGIEEDPEYRPFQDVDDVKRFATELRENEEKPEQGLQSRPI